MKGWASFLFGIAFVASFVVTIFLLWQDHTASATIGAGLTLSMGLFCFLPTLDSFQAFGLNAQFRKKLDEADQLLALLRETGSVSARLLAMNLAWSNRMGSPPETEKMEQMAELNAVLTKLNLSPDRVRQIQAPFIRMALFDLANSFFRAAQYAQYQVVAQYQGEANKRLMECTSEEANAITQTGEAISKNFGEGAFELDAPSLFELVEAEVKRLHLLSQHGLKEVERNRLDELAKRVLSYMRDCQRDANLTPDAARFLVESERAEQDRYKAYSGQS